MTTEWTAFGAGMKTKDSSYDQAVGGASLGKGLHKDVIISSVSPKDYDGKPAIELIWEKEGATKKHLIFIKDYNDAELFGSGYIRLAAGIIGDVELNERFFRVKVPANPKLLEDLIGCKADIVIDYPKTGYKINNVDSGGVQIIDIETNEEEGSFESYEEAKDHAKEVGIKLAYQNVKYVNLNQEAQENNVKQLRAATENSSGSSKGGVNKPQSVAF